MYKYLKKLKKLLKKILLYLYDFFLNDATEKILTRNDKMLYNNLLRDKENYYIGTIPRATIQRCVFLYYRKEDPEFKKTIEMGLNPLIDEIILLLQRAKMRFEPRPDVDFTALMLFLGTAARILAKKQEEEVFILNERDIKLYILSFRKDFDPKTRDYMVEFIDDLIFMLEDFIAMEIDKNKKYYY